MDLSKYNWLCSCVEFADVDVTVFSNWVFEIENSEQLSKYRLIDKIGGHYRRMSEYVDDSDPLIPLRVIHVWNMYRQRLRRCRVYLRNSIGLDEKEKLRLFMIANLAFDGAMEAFEEVNRMLSEDEVNHELAKIELM